MRRRTIMQRGTEWAATGKVTQEVPVSFPTENTSLQWPFFEDIHTDITAFVKKMQKYETGQSNQSFIVLETLMRENLNDPEKMNEYHSVIIDLLKSNKATDDCKMILLREFSWMANDSYIEVYKELSLDENLANYANYALKRIEKK